MDSRYVQVNLYDRQERTGPYGPSESPFIIEEEKGKTLHKLKWTAKNLIIHAGRNSNKCSSEKNESAQVESVRHLVRFLIKFHTIIIS